MNHPTAAGFGIPLLKAVPTAAFGLAMYVVVAGMCLGSVITQNGGLKNRLSGCIWLISFASVVATLYLIYLEAFVIHAWCQWCMWSALDVGLMFVVSSLDRRLGTTSMAATEPM